MDIQAPKPVSSVPSSPAAREVPVQEAPRVSAPPSPPKPEVKVEPPPVRDVAHTVRVVAEQLREYLKSSERDLEFSVDSAADTTVITVRDANGEVIRQIPNEEALRLMRRLNAESGTFIDETA